MPDVYKSEDNNTTASRSTHRPVQKTPRVPDPRRLEVTPGHTHNPFSAFCYYPERVQFETQEKEEKIVLLLRRHPVTNIPWILLAVVLVLAPSIVLTYIPFLEFLPLRFQFVSIILYYLVVTAYILEQALSWFFNVNIITDERIVDVDFKNLIYREMTDTRIDRIQEVTHKMGGAFGVLFNFGDVIIQTAGAEIAIEFEDVPNPARVQRILSEMQTEELQEQLEGRVR